MAEFSIFNDLERRNSYALLVNFCGVGRITSGSSSADIHVMDQRTGDRNALTVDKDGLECQYIRQVLPTRVRIVRNYDVALVPSVNRDVVFDDRLKGTAASSSDVRAYEPTARTLRPSASKMAVE